jgi:hypothetical protein
MPGLAIERAASLDGDFAIFPHRPEPPPGFYHHSLKLDRAACMESSYIERGYFPLISLRSFSAI